MFADIVHLTNARIIIISIIMSKCLQQYVTTFQRQVLPGNPMTWYRQPK